eukprot:TRINITY_DN9802_c0_g1_i2.p1 TRINITY_DN9802_c0_g1~~TRINITY_DN9802_c0_g1_i2.p1  ORF type:complete len:410 (-),score=49.11 TRINITY_DN9802_c0_g1_i2:21-1199(-)
MISCSQCHRQYDSDSKFCFRCATPLNAPTNTNTNIPPPVAPRVAPRVAKPAPSIPKDTFNTQPRFDSGIATIRQQQSATPPARAILSTPTTTSNVNVGRSLPPPPVKNNPSTLSIAPSTPVTSVTSYAPAPTFTPASAFTDTNSYPTTPSTFTSPAATYYSSPAPAPLQFASPLLTTSPVLQPQPYARTQAQHDPYSFIMPLSSSELSSHSKQQRNNQGTFISPPKTPSMATAHYQSPQLQAAPVLAAHPQISQSYTYKDDKPTFQQQISTENPSARRQLWPHEMASAGQQAMPAKSFLNESTEPISSRPSIFDIPASEPAEETTSKPRPPVAPRIKVQAIWDCEAEREGDLQFKTGDVITVLSKEDNDWWTGSLQDGRTGIFPANYVSSEV